MRAAQVEVICCHKCHEGLLVLAGVPAVTFGPPELAQLMQEAQATIAVAMLSSAGAGIVLGSIIACCNIIRAKWQRVRATGQRPSTSAIIALLRLTSPTTPGREVSPGLDE